MAPKNTTPTPQQASVVSQMAADYKIIDDATKRIADNLGYGNTIGGAFLAQSKEAKKVYQETGDMILDAAQAQTLLKDGNVEAYNQAISNMNLEQQLTDIAKEQVRIKKAMVDAMKLNTRQIKTTIPGMEGHRQGLWSDDAKKEMKNQENFIWLIKG